MIISFIQNSNCIDISKLMGFCVGAVFTGKKYGAYISQEYIAHILCIRCPTYTNLNLIQSTYIKSNLAIGSPAILLSV